MKKQKILKHDQFVQEFAELEQKIEQISLQANVEAEFSVEGLGEITTIIQSGSGFSINSMVIDGKEQLSKPLTVSSTTLPLTLEWKENIIIKFIATAANELTIIYWSV